MTLHAPCDCRATNAHAAFREAARALDIARTAGLHEPGLSDSGCRLLAGDVAVALEAMAKLVRSSGLEAVPTSPGAHSLHALVQHLSVGVSMARHTAGHGSEPND